MLPSVGLVGSLRGAGLPSTFGSLPFLPTVRSHFASDSGLRVGYELFLFKRFLKFCDRSVNLRLFLGARTNELSG
jgi:hypothetical protein